jgi:hypothetical protein
VGSFNLLLDPCGAIKNVGLILTVEGRISEISLQLKQSNLFDEFTIAWIENTKGPFGTTS